jgi:tetratricopeptide (TPR) repeat protein
VTHPKNTNVPATAIHSANWKPRLWRGLAILAICLAYANSFQNGFHFDDFHTVVDNPAIRSLQNVPRFFTDATTFSVLPANRTYRPMVSSSLALDYALGRGYKPLWFHLTTFVLFAGLFLLLERMYCLLLDRTQPAPENRWLALVAAAWFGLHPAMAETVNYVIQRGDLYCTLGCVTALFVFARYPRLRFSGLYLLPLVFALLSKPPAAVFPVLLFFYVFFFEAKQQRVRVSFLAALPSIVVTAGMLWLQVAMTPKTFIPSILSPWAYRLTQPYVWLRYFGEFILPVHLNVDTDLAPIGNLDLRVVAGLIFLLVLLTAIWITARRCKLFPIAFGLIWFVVTQLPTSLYPLSEVENDHRMFFSFVGLMLAAVCAGWYVYERLPSWTTQPALRYVSVALVLFALSGYAYGVHMRNKVWRDEASLWHDDVEKSPHNGRGLMIYGLTQMNKGEYQSALDLFTRALEFTPNYPTLEINLGVVNGAMADEGQAFRTRVAEAHFLRAIALVPTADEPHAYYGRWLKDHGRTTEAIAQLKIAIALNPQRLFQRDELIGAYMLSGDVDAAHEAAQQTLAIAPDDLAARQALVHPNLPTAVFWINRSLLQYRQGQYEQAIDSARRALQLDPNSAEAWNNIAAGDEGLHHWDEGIAAARKAIALKPDFQLAKNNLAWSLYQKRLANR